MRYFLLMLFLPAMLAGAPVLAGEGAPIERILDFDSRVVVGADGVLTVTETIRVLALGEEIEHGIYRDFPTIYRRPSGRRVNVGFEFVEMLRDGKPEPWFTMELTEGMRIFAGDEEVYIDPGEYTYTLTYRTDRQLGLFEAHDELYWNVTGNDWDFPMDRARATVITPGGAPVESATAYTGEAGDRGAGWRASEDNEGNPVFETTSALDLYEGLTIVVAWPKGYVTPPSLEQEARWLIEDIAHWLAGAAALLLVTLYHGFFWIRNRRYLRPGPIIPLFEPPEGFSPPAMRYVRHMTFDKKAAVAAVVDLAVRGRLKIEDGEEGGYRLVEQSVGGRDSEPAPADEKDFNSFLFAEGPTMEFGGKFDKRVAGAVQTLAAALYGAHDKTYFRDHTLRVGAGIALSMVSFFGVAVASMYDWSWLSPICAGVGGVYLLAINIMAAGMQRVPTAAGRPIMDRIEGFRMYLATAEQNRLNLLNPPERTPELFEKFLPYALALDVEHEWGAQFAGVLDRAGAPYRPDWCGSETFGGRRTDSGFAGGLSAGLGGSLATAATAPGSSSGSSSSGGSSGGGGGGGGGGGW